MTDRLLVMTVIGLWFGVHLPKEWRWVVDVLFAACALYVWFK